MRKTEPSLEPLMQSMQKHGLLNPIVVTAAFELVAGYRRLSAAKALGWDKIEATVIDIPNRTLALEVELEENTQRLAFSPQELDEARARLVRLRRQNAVSRFWAWLCSLWEETFDRRELRQKEKMHKNALLALLLPAGVFVVVAAAVTGKSGYISHVLHSLLDVCAFMMILLGAFFFARFWYGTRK